MINLDQLSPDQDNPLLAGDWQQKGPPSVDPTILTANPAKFPADDTLHVKPPRPVEPVTPVDAVDPVPAPSSQNPSPDTPGDLLSAPNDNDSTSSSLSPVPSARGHRDEERATVDPPAQQQDSHVPTSRQSTPLTELSGPISPTRVKEEDSTARVDAGSRSVPRKDGQDAEGGEGRSDAAEETIVAPDVIGEMDKNRPLPDASLLTNVSESTGDGSVVPQRTPAPNGLGSTSASPTAADGSQSDRSTSPQKPPTTDLVADEKASVILQLNTELLKVCIECQTRNVMQTPEFNTYAARLQSNLTWLAAAADRARQTQIPLPIMSPPTPLPFVSPQIINDYYQRLPLLFAKEIAKRQKDATQAGVKRGPDTNADDASGMRKRLDTGERRLSNPPPVSASPPHVRSPSVVSNGAGAPSLASETLSMMAPPQPSQQQQQTPLRMSPESAGSFPQSAAMSDTHVNQTQAQAQAQAQAQTRARQQVAIRQAQAQTQAGKDTQRMPPPAMTNGMPIGAGMGAGMGLNSAAPNPQMTQTILSTFGQVGLQHYNALQQGVSHPFVNYMSTNVPGFMQMTLQQQLQRMQMVQHNIQQARAQQAQRAAAAAAAGMNGTPQGLPDGASPFGRHSGSSPSSGDAALQGMPFNGMGMTVPPNVNPQLRAQQQLMQQQQQGMGAMAGIGLSMPGAAAQRPASSTAQNVNMTNLMPQQRQLLLMQQQMQQQMHQRGNDGVMNPQQAYADKMRQNAGQGQQHSPPHSAGSPSGPAGPIGMGSARSPTDPTTPRIQQKRLASGQMDPYQMALYNQRQAAANLGMRSGAAMGGIPPQGQPQPQPQQQQYGVGGGTVNPGMMYAGGMGGQPSPQQSWPTSMAQQQSPFHSLSPAALQQHQSDVGTPRPESSASNSAAIAPADTMVDSFESLFNWGGT